MKIIKGIKLKIDEEEVLRYQGCYNNEFKKVNQTIMKITQEEIERGYSFIEPKGIYDPIKIEQICFSSGRINLTNKLSLNFNSSMTDLLKGIDYLVLGVVTIGSSLENKVYELFSQGEYPRAVALDAVGTVSVRSLLNYMSSLVCQKAREQNLQTTKHFSPGSVDLAINQQKNIFQMISTDKIGVKLTKSCMMVPQKSFSWIMGIGKNITTSSQREGHSCKTCQAENCQFRKNF